MARPYEEVVIDGDTSSDEEDAVLVVTPQSRKRRRQSTIMDEEDEEAAPSAAQQQQNDNYDDDDDDDEIEIIQIPTPPKDAHGSASKRKSRRLTILDSDEELEETASGGDARMNRQSRDEKEEVDDEDDRRGQSKASPGMKNRLELEPVSRRLSLSRTTPTAATPNEARGDSTASSRRSSRIERKRHEKEKMGSSARKLEFLSLDNCLDKGEPMAGRGADDDDDEFIVDDEEEEEEEEEEEIPARKPRRRSPPPRERGYADGDDMDEFIVDDDEVEYMDDDEEGVMGHGFSSADEQEDDEEARIAMQSREPSEWFAIYMRYLEESIRDEDLDNKLHNARTLEHKLFKSSIHHIERSICSRRDALRSSVAWNDDIMESLSSATRLISNRCSATTDCQACRRANHFATQLVQFGGIAADANEMYRPNWMKRLRQSLREMEPIRTTFELGSVCHARVLGYWQLHHAKHFWVALVDAKRREASDGEGRILDSAREDFYKAEFGRYKRLIGLVDKFSPESSQSTSFMPNVWKKVTPHHVHTPFLPSPQVRPSRSDGPRRGTLDALVAESDDQENDEEEDEEEEADEEETEEEDVPETTQKVSNQPKRDSIESESDVELKSSNTSSKTARKRMYQSSIRSSFGARTSPHVESEATSKPAGVAMKPVDEIEAEDLLCLVCRKNQRDGAIVHGHYLHFYCCYSCAKQQHALKQGCMVCDRPIERVFRILPLSKEARAHIMNQRKST